MHEYTTNVCIIKSQTGQKRKKIKIKRNKPKANRAIPNCDAGRHTPEAQRTTYLQVKPIENTVIPF